MLTVYYNADYMALIENANTDDDCSAVDDRYAAYTKHLEQRGVNIDYDSDQTSCCWSGPDEWPDDLPDFWTWYNA